MIRYIMLVILVFAASDAIAQDSVDLLSESYKIPSPFQEKEIKKEMFRRMKKKIRTKDELKLLNSFLPKYGIRRYNES